jgi:hypothetical protein
MHRRVEWLGQVDEVRCKYVMVYDFGGKIDGLDVIWTLSVNTVEGTRCDSQSEVPDPCQRGHGGCKFLSA